jgi:hypothetical protein
MGCGWGNKGVLPGEGMDGWLVGAVAVLIHTVSCGCLGSVLVLIPPVVVSMLC